MEKTRSYFLDLISIEATDGVLLPSLLYSGADKPILKKLLVYVHGAGSSSIVRKPILNDAIASIFVKNGFDVLFFQNRGAGYITKFEKHDGGSFLGGMAYEKIADFSKDIAGVYKWATSNGYNQIYLAGHSTGANKLAHCSAWINSQPQIDQIALIGGGDDIGLQRQLFGNQKADAILDQAKEMIASGRGYELVAQSMLAWSHPISWISLQELLSLHSDYDTFPYARYDEYGSMAFKSVANLSKPTLAIYGSKDFGPIVEPGRALDILSGYNKSITTFLIDDANHNFIDKERELADALLRGFTDAQ